ncbi:MAG: NAD-dependent epimerase/dehydratase family protein, partial [Polyangiales bacterium]
LADRGATRHRGTIGDPNAILEAARGCEVMVHAAAVADHRSAPRALYWVNVAGTENAALAARHAGCSRFVFVSCGDVTLCNADRVHWNEDRTLMGRPLDHHARSKLLAEETAVAAQQQGLETVALRPGVLWGPGDTTNLPRWCREGLAGGIRLLGRGDNLVCTTYIDNLVAAIDSAAEVELEGEQIFHVTDGEFQESREFFRGISEELGFPPPRASASYGLTYGLAWMRWRLGSGGAWPTDVIRRGRSTYLDHQKASRVLEYEPPVSVVEGMKALAAWVQERGGPKAVAEMGRAPATADSVDEQVAAAGGD